MLHIVANPYFLSSFVLQGLEDQRNVTLVRHERPRRGLPASIRKTLEALVGSPADASFYYPREYVRRLRAIAPTDRVLLFGIDDLRELFILRRFLGTTRVAVFTWNPVLDYRQSAWMRHRHVRLLKRIGTVYTFDPEDARRHGLSLTDQVFRDISGWRDPAVEPDIDVYFLGQDKGRLGTLAAIRGELEAAGLATHFHVVRDRHRRYSATERELLAAGPLPYAENLALLNRSRSLLEVLQHHQSGPSVRCLEALYFDCRLVTTNVRIRECSLYDPERVFILGKDDPGALASFVRAPPVRWPSVLRDRHDVRQWYRQFA
jgi:hypothetical protein